MSLKIIKEGLVKFWKNPLIIFPFILSVLATIIISTPFMLYLFSAVSKLGLSEADLMNQKTLANSLVSIVNPTLVIFAIITFLAIIFLFCYFSAGAFGIALEIAKNKKPKLKDTFSFGRKFWFRYFVIYFLIFLIFFALLIIGGLIFGNSTASTTGNVLFNIYTFASMFFMILFISSFVIVILQNCKSVEAIKKSFIVSRKNYLSLLIISLLFYIATIAVEYIPLNWIALAINFAFLYPAFVITLALFALNAIGKKEPVEEEKKIAKKSK